MSNRIARIAVVLAVAIGLLAVAGPASARTPRIRKPSAPTDVVATPRSPTAIELSWAPPASDGGAPITSYTATVENSFVTYNGIFYPDETCTTTTTSCFVGGNGTIGDSDDSLPRNSGPFGIHAHPIRIRIVATNSVGNGRVAKVASEPAFTPNCSYVGPYAYLSNVCGITNWSGLDLHDAWLMNVPSFAGVNLSGTNLYHAYLPSSLTGADVNGANLDAVAGRVSVPTGGLTGTPAVLPPNYSLVDGYLVGPGADLSGASLSGENLSGMDLDQAQLSGADLLGADLSGDSMWDSFISETVLTVQSERGKPGRCSS